MKKLHALDVVVREQLRHDVAVVEHLQPVDMVGGWRAGGHMSTTRESMRSTAVTAQARTLAPAKLPTELFQFRCPNCNMFMGPSRCFISNGSLLS